MGDKEKSNYKISIGETGEIFVEAPTKEECLEMFDKVVNRGKKYKIDEAIR